MLLSHKKCCFKVIAVVILLTMTTSIMYLSKLSSKDPKWLTVGGYIKVLSPSFHEEFKKWQKRERLDWFENIALKGEMPLHAASGWGYMSHEIYDEMVLHVLSVMPIKSNDTVFELGCGVGAVFKLIRRVWGESISIGGSDLSRQAITKIREVFPNDTSEFYVTPMTKKNDLIKDNSKDHVISFGAMAMYLYKDEMAMAIKEALRIAKPGGHLCFTHFVEPDGVLKGSILEPVEKSFWSKLANEYSLEKLVLKQMIHQKDRYFVCFSKSL